MINKEINDIKNYIKNTDLNKLTLEQLIELVEKIDTTRKYWEKKRDNYTNNSIRNELFETILDLLDYENDVANIYTEKLVKHLQEIGEIKHLQNIQKFRIYTNLDNAIKKL